MSEGFLFFVFFFLAPKREIEDVCWSVHHAGGVCLGLALASRVRGSDLLVYTRSDTRRGAGGLAVCACVMFVLRIDLLGTAEGNI